MIQLITASDSIGLDDDLKQIYIHSFPPDERREWHELKELLHHPNFSLNKMLYGGELIGLISLWNFSEFVFIEHFALREPMRGKGIGSQVLKLVIEETSTKVVVEVEEPTNEMARRRIAFYERLGFLVCEGIYYQPSYTPEKSQVRMLLLSFPERILTSELDEIKTQLYREVYKYL